MCVEECAQKDAKTCPHCSRVVKYLYARPSFGAPVWACRLCHDLTYWSVQTRKTRVGNLVRMPGALRETERQCFAALETLSSICEPPPDEIVKIGHRAVDHWFRERDEKRKQLSKTMEMLNRIPQKLKVAALRNHLPERAKTV